MSLEELARAIEAECAPLLKSRDNRMRLALLDELDAEADRNGAGCGEDNYREAIDRLRAKYKEAT